MALRAVADHPKLSRLKSLLKCGRGEAMGYLEALWHFTGRFTPQGNIGKYSDAEIEAWIEWEGEAGKLMASLIESGWVDVSETHRLLIHDWHEHADDATKLALKRKSVGFLTLVGTPSGHRRDTVTTPSRLPEPVPVPEPVLELTLLSPAAPKEPAIRPEEFANTWNRGCGKLPRVEAFSDSRRKKVQARIRQGITLDRFETAVRCCVEKPHLRGENDRGWVATFDWLVDNDRNIEKAITNPYGLNSGTGHRPQQKVQILSRPGVNHA